MTTFVLRRLLQRVPLLLVISALTFGRLQLAPGAFTSLLTDNPQVSAAALEHMRHAFGLDLPA